MQIQSNNFVPLAEIAIQNPTLQSAVSSGTNTAFQKRRAAMFAESKAHGEAMREQAAEAKRRALDKLPELLEQAEANLTANGMQVFWAETAEEARQHIYQIIQKHDGKRVAKSKSMATEEISLNDFLLERGLHVIETDLGEYILQINEEHPSHIVAPVIHKTKEEIRTIFQEKLGMPYLETAEEMVNFARQKLREEFLSADVGISGGNFVIAETGSLGLVMNEGNGRMVTTLPKIHIALVGIEKIVETLEDYATLTQVLPRSGTGQNLTVYTNIINGHYEDNQPEATYVIFLDNGRSEIYQTDYAEALACIRCGACLNACPVYRSVGGHSYGWVYGGPIGAVITPLLQGLDHAKPLPHASSLCGSCYEVCPVKIDLPRMLLDLRHDLVEQGQSELKWNLAIKLWMIGNRSSRLFELGGKMARLGLDLGLDQVVPTPLGAWKEQRDFPTFAEKTFRQLWREKQAK